MDFITTLSPGKVDAKVERNCSAICFKPDDENERLIQSKVNQKSVRSQIRKSKKEKQIAERISSKHTANLNAKIASHSQACKSIASELQQPGNLRLCAWIQQIDDNEIVRGFVVREPHLQREQNRATKEKKK